MDEINWQKTARSWREKHARVTEIASSLQVEVERLRVALPEPDCKGTGKTYNELTQRWQTCCVCGGMGFVSVKR